MRDSWLMALGGHSGSGCAALAQRIEQANHGLGALAQGLAVEALPVVPPQVGGIPLIVPAADAARPGGPVAQPADEADEGQGGLVGGGSIRQAQADRVQAA